MVVVFIVIISFLISRSQTQYLGGSAEASTPAPLQVSPIASITPSGGGEATGVAFSPSGNLLATGDSNGKVYLWQATSRQPITVLPQLVSRGITSITFSPNGELLLAGGRAGATYLWNVTTRRLVNRYDCATAAFTPVTSVAFSPNGKDVATVGEGPHGGFVCVWQLDGETIYESTSYAGLQPTSVAFSPDSTELAVGYKSGLVQILPWSTEAIPTAIPGGFKVLFNIHAQASVTSIAYSWDDEFLAIGTSDGKTQVWSTERRQYYTVLSDPGQNAGVTAVEFARNDALLATADRNGTAYLWNTRLGSALFDPASKGINALAFSPSSTFLATADANGATYLWQVG